jgi:hypothetical protein
MEPGSAASHITREHAADAITADLDLVPPGVVLVSQWHPSGEGPRPAPAEVNC